MSTDNQKNAPEIRGEAARNDASETSDSDASDPGAEPASEAVKPKTKTATAPQASQSLHNAQTSATVRPARTGIRAGSAIPAKSQKAVYQIAAVVPVYNHPAKLEVVVAGIRKLNLPVILVDDGSTDETKAICDRLASQGVRVIHRVKNSGKGAAVIDGFKTACRLGFTHVIQIDADGQHDLNAVAKFLRISQKFPAAVVCGYPVYDKSVPLSRLWGRKLTNFWCSVNSLSMSFEDAMCGMRVYPLELTLSVIENAKIGRRMEFDPEILVRLLWAGARIKNAPVGVTYLKGGVSHFKGFADNLHISLMHAKLCTIMITRLPIVLFSRIFGWTAECEKRADPSCEGRAIPSAVQQSEMRPPKPQKTTLKPAPSKPIRTSTTEEERAARAVHAAHLATEEAQKKLAKLKKERQARQNENRRP